MSEKNLLDPSDIRVLQIMQRDASLSIAEIAREAGMSQTPCWRRIKKMKEAGVIRQLNILDRLASETESRVLSGWKPPIGHPSVCWALTCYMGSEPII